MVFLQTFTMPKLKQPLKLEFLSMKLVAECFQISFTYLESLKSDSNDTNTSSVDILRKEVECQLDYIPGPILEIVLVQVLHGLINKINSRETSKGLIEALDVLLSPRLKSVGLGSLLHGARLPRNISAVLLPMKFMAMTNLNDLDLVSSCTDETLSTLSRCCTSLKKLNISYSDLVTDAGLHYLCGLSVENENVGTCYGCKKIEWLGLEQIWETTVDGVRSVIESLPELKYLRYDKIGDIFSRKLNENYPSHSLSKLPKKHKEYGLTLFDQSYDVFTPSEELIDYVAECCPHICMLILYVPDKHLSYFKSLKKVMNFVLEIDGVCGLGLISYLESIGSNLVSIDIRFILFESRHLKALGRCCPKVKELKLMGSEICENEFLKNENYFTEMEKFNISISSNEGCTGTLLLYFISSSRELRTLTLRMSAVFLTDSYFKNQLLAKCPLLKLEELNIRVVPIVPFSSRTARNVLRVCPNLKILDLSIPREMQRSIKAIKALRKEMKLSNYDIIIT